MRGVKVVFAMVAIFRCMVVSTKQCSKNKKGGGLKHGEVGGHSGEGILKASIIWPIRRYSVQGVHLCRLFFYCTLKISTLVGTHLCLEYATAMGAANLHS